MNFIQSFDWLFILKVAILVLFFWLTNKVYHSTWLHSNKNSYTPDLSAFPPFVRPIVSNFFNEGFFFYLFTFIVAILFLIGAVTLFITFGDVLKLLGQRLSEHSFSMQMIICMGLIVIAFVFYGWLSKSKKNDSKQNIKSSY